jgi:hypothetical protein
METSAAPSLMDHEMPLLENVSAGLEAHTLASHLEFPSLEGEYWRKSSLHHLLSHQPHSDIWWIMGAITRRPQKPLPNPVKPAADPP